MSGNVPPTDPVGPRKGPTQSLSGDLAPSAETRASGHPANSDTPSTAGAAPPGADVTSGQILAGRYRIEEKLGEGGMGAVYKAHDTKLDRLVALKLMRAANVRDADAVTRFQREAKALAKIS